MKWRKITLISVGGGGERDALIVSFLPNIELCLTLWAPVKIGPLSAIVTSGGPTKFDKEWWQYFRGSSLDYLDRVIVIVCRRLASRAERYNGLTSL